MNIGDVQRKIKEMEKKNKWNNTPDEKIVFLVEEMGEISKWVRKSRSKTLNKKEKEKLSLEFADALQHLISLANSFDINLEEGLKKKKKI